MITRFLNIKEVCLRTSLSRATIWRLERGGKFPGRKQISANRVGWVEAELNDWLCAAASVKEKGGK